MPAFLSGGRCHLTFFPLVPKLHLGTSLWPKLCLGKVKLCANLVPKRSLGTRERLHNLNTGGRKGYVRQKNPGWHLRGVHLN